MGLLLGLLCWGQVGVSVILCYPPALEVSGVSERLAGISGGALKAWRLLLLTTQRCPDVGSKRQKKQELL